MEFGQAINALKRGQHVTRSGWNGKDMHLYLENNFLVPDKTAGGVFGKAEPCIVMFTAQGKHQPGWLASQADMLATDWEVVA